MRRGGSRLSDGWHSWSSSRVTYGSVRLTRQNRGYRTMSHSYTYTFTYPRTFTCYRPSPPPEYYKQGAANPPDEPQFEGVIFSDGTVVLRWLTAYRSHSVWTDWASMKA